MDQDSQEIISAKESAIKAHQYLPGQSGNPSGKPKLTMQQKEMMDEIKALGPKCVKAMEQILEGRSALARVRMIEIILSYILGKPESNVKVEVSMEERVAKSELRIAALVQSIKLGGQMTDAEYGNLGEPERPDEESASDRSSDRIPGFDGAAQRLDQEDRV
jgi:hypothetical protein